MANNRSVIRLFGKRLCRFVHIIDDNPFSFVRFGLSFVLETFILLAKMCVRWILLISDVKIQIWYMLLV